MTFIFETQPAQTGATASIPPAAAPPYGYMTAADATTWLDLRYALTPARTIADGIVLVASMAVDEYGPFIGVKANPEQDRQWPRTFKYGWPNIIAAPSPVMVAEAYPGAWPLTYEQVVPVQVLDWVALECYRMCQLPLDQGVVSESVTGASVRYSAGGKGDDPLGQLDRIQDMLLLPFQIKQGRMDPFVNFDNL